LHPDRERLAVLIGLLGIGFERQLVLARHRGAAAARRCCRPTCCRSETGRTSRESPKLGRQACRRRKSDDVGREPAAVLCRGRLIRPRGRHGGARRGRVVPLRRPRTRLRWRGEWRHVLRAQGAPTTRPLRATSQCGIEARATGVPCPPPRQAPMGVHAATALIVSGEAARTSRIARPRARRDGAQRRTRPRAGEVLAASSPCAWAAHARRAAPRRFARGNRWLRRTSGEAARTSLARGRFRQCASSDASAASRS
jgi:hypothetical protein